MERVKEIMGRKKDWTGRLYPNCYNNRLIKTLTEDEIKKLRNNFDKLGAEQTYGGQW